MCVDKIKSILTLKLLRQDTQSNRSKYFLNMMKITRSGITLNKGIKMPHQNVLNLQKDIRDRYSFSTNVECIIDWVKLKMRKMLITLVLMDWPEGNKLFHEI